MIRLGVLRSVSGCVAAGVVRGVAGAVVVLVSSAVRVGDGVGETSADGDQVDVGAAPGTAGFAGAT
ncbi:hypothetical protein [Kitasatospora cheerisanensis]|uniref:hypothetical protein n=1 Tax=Kitasatospora cheerisanensis TaxID=81942 RepID=UPI0012ED2558|nr:hypothetical protein [Kitasatospora cheerisanensis]